jgi:PadR family transcriptional regulator, regulatory protein PadR
MKKTQTDLLQGALDLLALKTLQAGPTHGWDIAQRIQQVSQDVLRVGQGSLYPALHRLEAQGWIASVWGASENNRKAKYYKLTPGAGNNFWRRPRRGDGSSGRWN